MRDQSSILRFTTSGSVDDGKSTLIGRLLYDTRNIRTDQWSQVEKVSKSKGLSEVDLALLTDGLRDEQEQGITIDVAYRYFATAKRKFIIADCPGHIQYTRNMVTGASTASLSLVLIDARNGLSEQSRRHIVVASLLKIPHMMICVNKMDLCNWSEEVYEGIVKDVSQFVAKLDLPDLRFIPISALKGDNVVSSSAMMPWYEGGSLLNFLETLHVASDHNLQDVRFPVQGVIRPRNEEHTDFRGYSGSVLSGVMKPGDEVMIQPQGRVTRIREIYNGYSKTEAAFPPMSVVVTLEDDVDLSRGDMIVRPNNSATKVKELDALVCWLDKDAPVLSGKYIVKHTTREVFAKLNEVLYVLDINTLHRDQEATEIRENDIFRAKFKLADELMIDPYDRNKQSGSFIIIDPRSNHTVGAAVLRV